MAPLYYIKSEVNTASDLSSRGCSLTEPLKSKDYWHGPSFLCKPSHNYKEMTISTIQLKKNIKQILDEEKKISKPNCFSFGDPTFDCSLAKEGVTKENIVSHHLCLKGLPSQTLTNADFRDFWLNKHKQPEKRGLTECYPSWGKLRRIIGCILQFFWAAREGWSKKSSKKPTKLSLKLKIDDISKIQTFSMDFPYL